MLPPSTYIYCSPSSPQLQQSILETESKIMIRVQGGSLRVHTFSSAACVHAVESSDDDASDPSNCSRVLHSTKKASRKEIKKRIEKLLSSLRQKQQVSGQAFRSSSEAAAGDDASAVDVRGGQSDMETFVSAKSSEVCSFCTDDDDDDESELPSSFRLRPPIFPATGGGGGAECRSAASPMKIIKKLPFGFVIGRQLDAPAAAPSMKLSLNLRRMVPKMADLQLRSKSKMIKKKVVCALKERFGRRGSRRGSSHGDGDDEDVFWKKDVRGLRCRRVEDNDSLS